MLNSKEHRVFVYRVVNPLCKIHCRVLTELCKRFRWLPDFITEVAHTWAPTVISFQTEENSGLLLSSSVPSPRVHITRTPFTDVYPSTRLNLTCITELNSEVDTPVTVTHSWQGPSGSISRYSSQPTVSNVTRAGQVYWSSIFFSSGMRASDSGTYYCTSSTSSSSSSSYIVTSGSVVASTSVSVGKESSYYRLS